MVSTIAMKGQRVSNRYLDNMCDAPAGVVVQFETRCGIWIRRVFLVALPVEAVISRTFLQATVLSTTVNHRRLICLLIGEVGIIDQRDWDAGGDQSR